MIRIMHVSSSLAFGGLERVIKNFASKLDSTRYAFAACCLQSGGLFADQIQEMGLPVHILGKQRGFSPNLWARLYSLFVREKIDIVHTHNFAPLLYSAIPARCAGVKVLVHTDHARTCFPDLPRRMMVERWLSRCVDSITAVSDQVKQDLVKYEKIDKGLIKVILNGIEIQDVPPTVSTIKLREEFQIPEGVSVVGACCRLAEQKGVAYLLKAAAQIVRRNTRIVFLIVGDGELRNDLEHMSTQLGLNAYVRFAGFRSDIVNILNLLDVYVLPSLFEGTPLGLLEAMLARKPVVATLVGSNECIIEDTISGRLVESRNSEQLANSIEEILANPHSALTMGERARERVLLQFSLDRMIGDYDKLYTELIASRRRLGWERGRVAHLDS